MKGYKGQIFVMSILILSSVMVVGMLLITAFARDIRQATESSESVRAFYAADSGIEWELYKTFVNEKASGPSIEGANISTKNLLINGGTEEKSIKSIGICGKVKRGMEMYFE